MNSNKFDKFEGEIFNVANEAKLILEEVSILGGQTDLTKITSGYYGYNLIKTTTGTVHLYNTEIKYIVMGDKALIDMGEYNNLDFGTSDEYGKTVFESIKRTSGTAGAILNVANDKFTSMKITNVEFKKVTSTAGPGALSIAVEDKQIDIVECEFEGCEGVLSGGAISVTFTSTGSGVLTIDKCKFTTCKSEDDGGAISVSVVDSKTVNIKYTTFENCEAKKCGGGVYVSGGGGEVNF